MKTQSTILCCFVVFMWACGGGAEVAPAPAPVAPHPEQLAKQSPPPSAAPRDIHFPPIERTTLVENGFETNLVEWHELPIVQLQLVIKSGGEMDPRDKPGLSALVAAMLKEGTKHHTSAELADAVEYLGAELDTGADEENIYISIHAMSQHLDQAMSLLAEVATEPKFDSDELRKLKARELDRLTLQEKDPNFLATREMYKALYGNHPYAHVDTNRDVVKRVQKGDLSRWHKTFFVPSNAFLVVVGDVSAEQVQAATVNAFGKWRGGRAPAPRYAATPTIDSRRVILVDRPESAQSVIAIGNLSLQRNSADYIPLVVANQVLGGSAASRLFMDLRERRSLTYGAYSRITETVQEGVFRARASVRNAVTDQALTGFMEHLNRIVAEAAPEAEIADAERYLSDSFPLKIDSPGKVADLISDLRIYGLPDDYWDGYRTAIRQVTPDQALAAAQRYIRPTECVMVVVGKAADLIETLKGYGPVTVVDASGKVVQTVAQAPAAASGG